MPIFSFLSYLFDYSSRLNTIIKELHKHSVRFCQHLDLLNGWNCQESWSNWQSQPFWAWQIYHGFWPSWHLKLFSNSDFSVVFSWRLKSSAMQSNRKPTCYLVFGWVLARLCRYTICAVLQLLECWALQAERKANMFDMIQMFHFSFRLGENKGVIWY